MFISKTKCKKCRGEKCFLSSSTEKDPLSEYEYKAKIIIKSLTEFSDVCTWRKKSSYKLNFSIPIPCSMLLEARLFSTVWESIIGGLYSVWLLARPPRGRVFRWRWRTKISSRPPRGGVFRWRGDCFCKIFVKYRQTNIKGFGTLPFSLY